MIHADHYPVDHFEATENEGEDKMTNETTIPALLQRWSEVQPEVCVQNIAGPTSSKFPAPLTYTIGEYIFWMEPEPLGFFAMHLGQAVTGRPALDWLRGAVEAAIEASPGKCKLQLFGDLGWAATVGYPSGDTVFYESAAVALLTAFVEWAEGQVAA